MLAIEFPKLCTFRTTAEILQQHRVWELADDFPKKIQLRFTENYSLRVDGIACLCLWALKVRNQTSLSFDGVEDCLNYLSRMDFFKTIEYKYSESFSRRSHKGRFLPLTRVHYSKSCHEIVDALCELILAQFENSQALIPAFEWCTNEITDNILQHADSQTSFVSAQSHPHKKKLDIVIIDAGKGIKNSLAESYHTENDEEAIKLALKKGITRNKSAGQGNGLAGSKEILEKNGGLFQIHSGSCLLRMYEEDITSYELPFYQGTHIFFEFNTDRPVNLEDTFLGKSAFNYLDKLIENCPSRFLIKENCIHCGSRESASGLRRKLKVLLNGRDDPLELDFSNIPVASSSFLDELLGKLIVEIGEDRFNHLVRIKNMNGLVKNLANYVIGERLREQF